jgi:hypothetical protein
MPILPPSVAAPYDPVSTILNAARTRLNDAVPTLVSLSGKVLQDTEAFTQQMTNNAWRRMQEQLANYGYTGLNTEVVIPSIPVVASTDPASQCYLSWTGFFDGVNLFDTPNLPFDFILPLKVWERTSGQNACFSDVPMEQILDGLPSRPKVWANYWWEWRQDAIYFPGSQIVEDFRIKYARYLGDFVDVGDVRWFDQPAQIMRCADSFSWYIAAEFVSSRGDAATALEFTNRGADAAKLVMNREIRQKQRVNVRRRPRPSSRGWGYGMLG